VNRPRDPCYGPSVAGVADEQAPSPQEAPSRPPVRRALLVEDDPHLRRTLARSLRAWGVEVVEAGTASEARTALAMRFDLVLCDVRLPDGSGLVVVRQAGELRPAPVVIAMSGAASASEGWDIARAGAQAFLEKPVSPEALERAVSAALESPPQLEPLVAACVGLRPLRDLQSEVRTVMIEQALALSRGNQSEAARLLREAVSLFPASEKLDTLHDRLRERRRSRIVARVTSGENDPLERRWRRNQALRWIHELRSLAHVVDMHQLTKDPQHTGRARTHDTASSPKRTLTPYLLSRYLDYCSEMFSLIGKVAALYVQDLDDATVIASVSDVDQLTTGLSRKVWQKIVILHSLDGSGTPLTPAAADAREE